VTKWSVLRSGMRRVGLARERILPRLQMQHDADYRPYEKNDQQSEMLVSFHVLKERLKNCSKKVTENAAEGRSERL
jgi:hypothetical protein